MTGSRAPAEWIAANGLTVLLYHRVGPPIGGPLEHLNVPTKTFARQMDWLQGHGYTGIALADVLLAPEGLPPKPVALTFDDGYADLFHHAWPELARRGFRATVFVVTGSIGGTNAWEVGAGGSELALLDARQIREMARAGVEFGAHGRTHRDLTSIPAGELDDEIAGSRRDLADVLGAPVRAFAYPYGSFDERVLDVTRREFGCACTIVKGINRRAADLQRLRRTMVRADYWSAEFACRVLAGRNLLEDLRVRVATWRGRIPASST